MTELPVIYSEEEKVWSGPPRSTIYKEDTSLGRIIFHTMRNWPKNVCLICDITGVSLTFEQVLTWAIRIAQSFRKRLLNHKNIIGIAAKNSTYVMPLVVACLMNGTPFHAVSPVLDEATLKHMFSITKPKLIFCDGNVWQKIHAATIDWRPEIFIITGKVEGVLSIESLLDYTDDENIYQPEPLAEGGNQTVVILCSSGTTGLPKAICLSNNEVLPMPMANSESVIYTASGLDWTSGLAAYIIAAALGSTMICSSNPLTPEYFVHLMKKYKITHTSLAPWYLSAICSCPEATAGDLKSLRKLFFTGGAISSATGEKLKDLFRNAVICASYGLTETGTISMSFDSRNCLTAGRPFTGVRVKIIDETNRNLGPNEVGEICVQVGNHWNGYFGNSEATQNVLDSEGWFHTGDLGYLDDQHLLHIVDRKKAVLKYLGYQYWTFEIEKVISELPGVQDVCVVGIYDERVGDAAGALVVRTKGSNIKEQEITEHVGKRLPPIRKQLHSGVQFTDHLPANLNGKVDRKAAREEFLAKKELI
ncbi:luciferin 4-monooxygenase-like [Drosophila takahashii]|uniref:luciferin 4-monooxygenase-like n=1 Tax=Drosophila takahashii TaxID=29030 RepID=UPI001CF8685B|nr:luciferin 4-monooxygenase-like [Drosophila takahashii]